MSTSTSVSARTEPFLEGTAVDVRSSGCPDTPTTGFYWSRASGPTSRRCAARRQPFLRRWACACRRRRQRLPTSMRAWTSSAGASSVTESQARSRATSHLPAQEARRGGHQEGADAQPVEPEVSARSVAAHPQPSAARLVHLLPARRVRGNLPLPARVHLAPSYRMDPPQDPGMTWKQWRRRYCHGGWWPTDGEVALFDPGRMRTTRYRYRGAAIPNPWASAA